MSNALVICIGNVARGDDGVAHEVCRLLQGRVRTDGVDVLAAPDLDIAMAGQVAEASLLVVVDAERRTDPPVRTEKLEGAAPGSPTGHGIDAPGLLALARVLYGREPEAMLVSVAAPLMEHSTALSDTARASATEAAAVVETLISQWAG